MNPNALALVLPIAAMMIPVVIVPTVLILRYATRRREWEHAERMKALEMGQPELGQSVATRESAWPRAAVCIMIGAVLPIVSFALTASLLQSGLAPELWLSPVVVSVVAVPCGCGLAAHLFRSGGSSERPSVKPAAGPEVHDFAGYR